jgi:hypothetical protein
LHNILLQHGALPTAALAAGATIFDEFDMSKGVAIAALALLGLTIRLLFNQQTEARAEREKQAERLAAKEVGDAGKDAQMIVIVKELTAALQRSSDLTEHCQQLHAHIEKQIGIDFSAYGRKKK